MDRKSQANFGLRFEVGIDLKWLVLRLVEPVLVAWYTWCQDLQCPQASHRGNCDLLLNKFIK